MKINYIFFPSIFAIFFSVGLFSSLNILESQASDTKNAEETVETQTEQIEVTEKIAEKEPAIETIDVQELPKFKYLEVIDSCGVHYEGECLVARSGPGTEYPVVKRIRERTVLKIGKVVRENEELWYEIEFAEWLRYPERVTTKWYVFSDYVQTFTEEGTHRIEDVEIATSTKKIIVNKNEQMLYAYEGQKLFMKSKISTGLQFTPTPRGKFEIWKKTPSRYMQGPLPGVSSKYWDLPGVPWNLYFSKQGAVIHGVYWHDDFGQRASSGCVNMKPFEARTLYKWAEVGTPVIVK